MPLQRIVKMTFRAEEIPTFLTLFAEVSPKIRAFPGCEGLRLLRSREPANVLFTYSWWTGEEALHAYRQSELFRATWVKTKALFADRPQAWSTDLIADLKD
ncbi:MAG: antibiotic biosynthesis monooxygenase family protein [Bacteroidota bacterium]